MKNAASQVRFEDRAVEWKMYERACEKGSVREGQRAAFVGYAPGGPRRGGSTDPAAAGTTAATMVQVLRQGIEDNRRAFEAQLATRPGVADTDWQDDIEAMMMSLRSYERAMR